MKKLILIIVIAGIAFLGYLSLRHPIILKAATGSARILSPPLNTTVKFDGVVQPSAKCFEMKSYFNGSPADRLVLWLEGTSVKYNVLIIDKSYRDVGSPNSDNLNYDLLWNRYLFQAESAVEIVSFKSEKSYAQDPKLETREKYMKFVIPKSSLN